jgi:peptidoglycan hydrolase-like protein with peptidoglycan-binding domain
MKWLFSLAFPGFLVLPSWAGPDYPDAQKSDSLSAQSSAKSPKKSSSRARGRYVKGRRSPRKAGPSYQLHPDPERYQEIQKALAERGYFKGEVNGQWGEDSIDALKRFQADQKLPDDGKINALSLIGLGLGPKHNGSVAIPTNGQAPPVSEPVPPSLENPPH